MAYPTPPEYRVNQGFRSYATAGVVGRPDGAEIQYLVWLYGDYQHYGHAGTDIACPIGTPVYAIADGIVVWADWGYNLPGDDSWGPNGYFKRWGLYKNFPGICTVIWHPQLNKFSVYGHQSSNDEVKVGQQVREGQQIGKSGNTKTRGETVGPHLHIAIVGDFTNYSTGGKYIFGCEDPVPYFNTGSLSYASESITLSEEDDMGMLDEEITRTGGGPLDGKPTTLRAVIANFDANVHYTREAVKATVAATVEALLTTKIYRAGGPEGQTDLASTLAYLDANLNKLDAKELLDPEAIKSAVGEATRESLKDLSITLSSAPGAEGGQ